MSVQFADSPAIMRRAIQLAERGRGFVEPNPMVGAVIVDSQRNLLGEGYHGRFGGPHAEVNALAQAKERAEGATMFVTLEPCSHHGQTPPCSKAVIDAEIQRVIVAMRDPSPQVAGNGIAQLKAAGLRVEVGLLAEEARRLIAPFLKLTETGLPYVHAKWAMTLDGKIASSGGHSQWISNEKSRQIVHHLRGWMDAILVGSRTVSLDDPLLTARPPGPRTAMRIVIDSQGQLALKSQLVRSAQQAPVLVAACESAPQKNVSRLRDAGVEVLLLPEDWGVDSAPLVPLKLLLEELGCRRLTNIFVEGGSELLGSFFDQNLIDEIHVFLAPKLLGGRNATTPLGGIGLKDVPQLAALEKPEIEIVAGDIYIHGPLFRTSDEAAGSPEET